MEEEVIRAEDAAQAFYVPCRRIRFRPIRSGQRNDRDKTVCAQRQPTGAQLHRLAPTCRENPGEIQEANGEPLKGLTLNDCKPLRGDENDAQQPKIGRGKSWVRSHPFWIRGLAQNGALSDVVEYRGEGFIRPGGIATLVLLKNQKTEKRFRKIEEQLLKEA